MRATGSGEPLVSIVVACRNERNHIENCARSILAQESPAGGFEVIIADGMSDDGTREILHRLAGDNPRLRIIDNRQRFVASGLNAAIQSAIGEIIIRMDAHTEYPRDYVLQCLSVSDETGADNVGGPARTRAKNYLQSAIAAAYHSPFAVGGARFHDVNFEGQVDTVTYGCWRREIFDRIGLFDEEMLNTEDDEFNLRLTRHGGTVWQSPRIESWYYPRDSLGDLFRQYMNYGYWKVRLIQKHKIPASVRHLVPVLFVFSLSVSAVAGLWSSIAAWTWVLLTGTYLMSNIVASFLTAARTSWKLFPILPLVFMCYHFSYGYGSLRGIIDFLVFRRGPTLSYTKLSRK